MEQDGPTVADESWLSEGAASDALGHRRFNAGAWGKFIGYLELAYNTNGRSGVTRASVERELAYRAQGPTRAARLGRMLRRFVDFV